MALPPDLKESLFVGLYCSSSYVSNPQQSPLKSVCGSPQGGQYDSVIVYRLEV